MQSPELSTDEPLQWITSSECAASTCVRVAMGPDGQINVGSTVNEGLTIRYTQEEWRAFIGGVLRGEFTFGINE